MNDMIAQIVDEIKALGFNCFLHGPEIWLVFPLLCLVAGIVGFEVFSRWEDDDDD